LLIGLLLFLVACAQKGDTWQRIQKSGVLKIGLDPTYPPFEAADDGQLQGLDVDLAQAIAGEMGLQTEFIYFGFDGLYDALSTGQVDVLLSALIISPERTRDFAYSQSYFDAGQILVTPVESNIEDIQSLAGQTIAVELGTEGHVQATTWKRRLDNLKVDVYNTSEEALNAVTSGQAGAAIVDNVSGLLYLRQSTNLSIARTPITSEPYAFVTRIDDNILLDKLNESLDKVGATGQLENIISTWLR
jgi:polar amino acid transport system substrate-binding protein